MVKYGLILILNQQNEIYNHENEVEYVADGLAFCYDRCVINECSQMVRRSFLGLCKLGGHLLKTGRKKRDVLFEISLNCTLQLNIKIRALLTAKRAKQITMLHYRHNG